MPERTLKLASNTKNKNSKENFKILLHKRIEDIGKCQAFCTNEVKCGFTILPVIIVDFSPVEYLSIAEP
jgi:hypothetical protein